MQNKDDKGLLWLYPNQYKQNDKHPIKTGTGEIPKAVLRTLVNRSKETKDGTVKIQCAAWERVSKKGNPYIFVTLDPEERKPKDAVEDEIPF